MIVALMLIALQPPPEAIPHLWWAQQLVNDIQPENNHYGSKPTLVQWRGVDGAELSRNRSVCSTFITALWRQAYGYRAWEMRQWLGSPSPRAIDYHVAIQSSNRFEPITRVREIRPGDLLASRQLRGETAVTGHLMIAASRPVVGNRCRAPQQATNLAKPVPCRYQVKVIDVSRSGHGRSDTRTLSGGPEQGGVGIGTIVIDVDDHDQLLGYRWSDRAQSPLRSRREEPLLVGRFCDRHCPSHR